jgi:hypothetical protein
MQPESKGKRKKWRSEAEEFTKEFNKEAYNRKQRGKATKNKKRGKRYKEGEG